MSAGRSETSVVHRPSTAMGWFLAALSIGAGAIHLAMVPQHAPESLRVGLAFAAAGWFQIAFGIAMLARPTRLWVKGALAANVALVATWLVSRTAGLPTWSGDGGVEDASSTDVLCVAFEVGIVAGAVALLAVPSLLERWERTALTAASVVPVSVLVATTAVFFDGAATFELPNPNILLFDGDGPDAKFAGVSYTVAEKPEGFTGDYDVWHSHTSACRQGASIVSLSEEDSPVWLSESECIAQGGQVFPLSNAEMMHLWIGPDYIDGAPIFAHDHPELYDGYHPKRDA